MKRELRSKQQSLEKALEKLESADQSKRSAAAKELVQELVILGGSKERVALMLGFSPATLYRWASGKFVPRDLSKIKSAISSSSFVSQLQHPSGTWPAANDAGIHSMDIFFETAALANRVFKFKSFLEFQVGESAQVQRRMKQLLEENKELRIYYVFPSQSKADDTLSRFYELVTTMREEWASRIHKCPVNDNSGVLALSIGYTGLIIVEYSDAGKKRFGRLVDILVEVPVRAYENGEPNASVKKSIVIELPTEQAHTLWSRWKTFLEDQDIINKEQARSVA